MAAAGHNESRGGQERRQFNGRDYLSRMFFKECPQFFHPFGRSAEVISKSVDDGQASEISQYVPNEVPDDISRDRQKEDHAQIEIAQRGRESSGCGQNRSFNDHTHEHYRVAVMDDPLEHR